MMYHIEGVSKITFFASALFLSSMYTKSLAAIICILGLLRNKGMIRFNKQYLQSVA